MNKNIKIYVCGHTGMVGSAILRHLKHKGYTNILTCLHSELDLTKQAPVKKFLEQELPDYIYMCAAKVGGIIANSENPANFLFENLMIQMNIIESAHINNVQDMLFLGSSCIYPRLAVQPMTEDALLSGHLEPTNEGYAIAKIAGIKLCETYNKQYGRNYRSIMPSNLYGPGDNFHPVLLDNGKYSYHNRWSIESPSSQNYFAFQY